MRPQQIHPKLARTDTHTHTHKPQHINGAIMTRRFCNVLLFLLICVFFKQRLNKNLSPVFYKRARGQQKHLRTPPAPLWYVQLFFDCLERIDLFGKTL